MPSKYPVFISYSSKDEDFVEKLVGLFERIGIAYWKAPEMIPAGSSYAQTIPKAIRESDVVLLVLSKHAMESIWVEKELDTAISNRKIVLPIMIEPMTLNDTFSFYLNNVQMIPFYKSSQRGQSEMLRKLQAICKLKIDAIEQFVEMGDSSKETGYTSQMKGTSGVLKSDAGKEQSGVLKSDSEREKSGILRSDSEREKSGMLRGSSEKANAFRINRIPSVCSACGSNHLQNVRVGTYVCLVCGTENFDDFQTVRNYLAKVGHASAVVIERETKVPRRTIEYLFQKEYLEIPSSSSARARCKNCGAPIRTGTLCEKCKNEAQTSTPLKPKWRSSK